MKYLIKIEEHSSENQERKTHGLNPGPHSRWLKELRSLELMMKNEDDVVVGHIMK